MTTTIPNSEHALSTVVIQHDLSHLLHNTLILTLDQLIPSPFNPRITDNPKYQEIKESIRARGLDRPPRVTRQPGCEKWVIADGGNTRLRILNELYQEYGQRADCEQDIAAKVQYEEKARQFFHVTCQILDWRGETHAFIGHLVENDMRGDMLFYDKATAMSRLADMIEAELREPQGFARYPNLGLMQPLAKHEHISNRQLAKVLSQLGWSVDHSIVATYRYAADNLFNLIPSPFLAGAGHTLARQISKTKQAYIMFCNALDASKIATSEKTQQNSDSSQRQRGFANSIFDAFWEESLTLNDQKDFEIASVRHTMDHNLSEFIGMEQAKIHQYIEDNLRGGESELNKRQKAQSPMQSDLVVQHKDPFTDQEVIHLIQKLATEWNIRHLLKENHNDNNSRILNLSLPETPFAPNNLSAYVWVFLYALMSMKHKSLSALLEGTFAEDISLAELLRHYSVLMKEVKIETIKMIDYIQPKE